MTLQESFDEFLYTKEVDGLKDGSIHNYRITIGYFLDAMGAGTPLNLLELKKGTGVCKEVPGRPYSPCYSGFLCPEHPYLFRLVLSGI